MRSLGGWLFVTAALAACSSSSAGGGTGSGAGGSSASSASGSGGASSTSPAGPGGTGGFGGAVSGPDPNGAAILVWTQLQGAFDSADQGPRDHGGYVPPSARRLVGCAVDAPELGDRVVYLERAPMEEDAAPDRQFLLVLEDRRSTGPGMRYADGVIVRPLAPEEWVGRCVVGTTMPLVGEVELVDGCEMSISRNEVGGVSASGGPMPTRCVSASLDAGTVEFHMGFYNDKIDWSDILDQGLTTYDPPRNGSVYVFVRRSP